MGLLKRGGEFSTHPKGSFIFTIADVEEDDGQYGPQLKWRLDSSEVDPKTGEVFSKPYWTGLSLSEKGKLYGLISAAGFDPTDDYWDRVEGLQDFECLFGKQVLGQVTHEPGKEPGAVRDKIATVIAVPAMPARSAGPKKAPAAAPERELVGAAAGAAPDWGGDD